jgi:pimeloyl-ACP methyl ester carboxylesterase
VTTTAIVPEPAQLREDLTSLRSRFGFRFSLAGATAAAPVADGRGAAYLEFWRLHGNLDCRELSGTWTSAGSVTEAGVPCEPTPYDDGSVLFLRRRPGEFDVHVVTPDGDSWEFGPMPGIDARIIAGRRPGPVALIFCRQQSGTTMMWRLADLGGRPAQIGSVPGPVVAGSGWLDTDGAALLVNVRLVDRVEALVVDPETGEYRPLFPNRTDSHRVLLTSASTGRLLLAERIDGEWRLSAAHAADPGDRTAIPVRDDSGDQVVPITFDPGGRRILVHIQRGMASRLAILDVSTGECRDCVLPLGAYGTVAVWGSADGREFIRTVFVSSAKPFRVLTFDPDGGPCHMQPDGTPGNTSPRWAPSTTVRFPHHAGSMEALVHGHTDWRTAEHVVVALHGGPQKNWTMKFHQLFQYLAAFGVTVIAPNPRGSSGYGQQHRDAIQDAWGVPDLADVTALGRHLRSERPDRPAPSLYGHSYGAFLALIAAAHDPEGWRRAAVVAPFLSAPRLYDGATPEVRALVERLGGLVPARDAFGPRDVLRLAGRIRAELLVVHGTDDDVIPVRHSRLLRDRAEAASMPIHYIEVPGAGHSPLDGSLDLHLDVARFLSGAS